MPIAIRDLQAPPTRPCCVYASPEGKIVLVHVVTDPPYLHKYENSKRYEILGEVTECLRTMQGHWYDPYTNEGKAAMKDSDALAQARLAPAARYGEDW